MSYLRYLDLVLNFIEKIEKKTCNEFTNRLISQCFDSQVLEEHELLCTDLFQVNTDGVILTKQSE